MENPIKMDDLVVPLFLETPTCEWNQKLENFPGVPILLMVQKSGGNAGKVEVGS